MERQISSWRKEISIIAETGTGYGNSKLNRKKRKIFQKYEVANAREEAQLTETLKQKVRAKAQRIRRYEKRETRNTQSKMFTEDTKKILQKFGHEEYRGQRTPVCGRSRTLLIATVGRESTA
jgi:uncharacterized membrane protein